MKLRISLHLALLLISGFASVAMAANDPDLVLQGGKVYPSPTAASIDDAVVLVRDGRIMAVTKRNTWKISGRPLVIDCTGKVIVAGFWNSHVHFETGWQDVQHLAAEKA